MTKKKKNNLIKTFVIVGAFVIVAVITFGITLAFFGESNKDDGVITLKTGVWVHGSSAAISGGQYVVPSQIVTAQCTVNVKSGTTASSNALTGAGASKGLLRATITFAGDSQYFALPDNSTYFPVKIGGTTIGNFVRFSDGNYYLMNGSSNTSISTTGDNTTSDLMYIIDTTAGEKSLTYDLSVSVPTTITRVASGKSVTLNVYYTVIQSDFYSGMSELPKTVSNAKTIFDSVDTRSANY